jgi:hypothetical protein
MKRQSVMYGLKPVPFKGRNAQDHFNKLLVAVSQKFLSFKNNRGYFTSFRMTVLF